MPEISRFFGIVIQMFYREHHPPHFHAVYSGREVEIEIATLAVVHGDIPGRALGLVIEWARLHQAELATDWELAREKQPLHPIRPL